MRWVSANLAVTLEGYVYVFMIFAVLLCINYLILRQNDQTISTKIPVLCIVYFRAVNYLLRSHIRINWQSREGKTKFKKS